MSEITLGQAKKNVESGMMLDAKEASIKLQRETAAARQATHAICIGSHFQWGKAETRPCFPYQIEIARYPSGFIRLGPSPVAKLGQPFHCAYRSAGLKLLI